MPRVQATTKITVRTYLRGLDLYSPNCELLLDQLFETREIMQRAGRDVKSLGATIEEISTTGDVKYKTNPSWVVYKDSHRIVMELISSLGMSPADAIKLKLFDAQEEEEEV